MRHLLTITLMLLLVLLSTSALAERSHGYGQGDQGVYASHRALIGQRFEYKADRAAAHGHYRQAKHFRTKGEQLNRHLDRRDKRFQARFEQRCDIQRQRHHLVRPHLRYENAMGKHRSHNNFVGVVIRQPGLWFGWNTRY